MVAIQTVLNPLHRGIAYKLWLKPLHLTLIPYSVLKMQDGTHHKTT